MNDGKKVEVGYRQVMKCIVCYDNVINILNPITKKHKGLITYYKTYGIIVLNKHGNAFHSIIAKKFEEEINNEITKNVERQPKKKPNIQASAISTFFVVRKPFKKDDV
jgi:uncharacterized protein (UPF0333 family)